MDRLLNIVLEVEWHYIYRQFRIRSSAITFKGGSQVRGGYQDGPSDTGGDQRNT